MPMETKLLTLLFMKFDKKPKTKKKAKNNKIAYASRNRSEGFKKIENISEQTMITLNKFANITPRAEISYKIWIIRQMGIVTVNNTKKISTRATET